MKLKLMILFTLTLSACTTSVHNWSRTDGRTTDMAQDKAQCQYEAKAATASYHSSPSANDETHGMGNAVGDGIIIAEKQIELLNDCMRLKGYVGK
ncbi:hypothetical protein [Pseudomonas antarctica]|uniref:hypothetical protein n=1 Tax=Pseudomonas antarctica TaxID=219572 RepID=UPI00387AA155